MVGLSRLCREIQLESCKTSSRAHYPHVWTFSALKTLQTLSPEQPVADLCHHIKCFTLQSISKISFSSLWERKKWKKTVFTDWNFVISLWILYEQSCENTEEVNVIFFINPDYPKHTHFLLQLAQLPWCQFIFAILNVFAFGLFLLSVSD